MSRYYTEVSVERTHSQIRNSAWNKKVRSRYYAEFSVERTHFHVRNPSRTSFPLSYWVSHTVSQIHNPNREGRLRQSGK